MKSPSTTWTTDRARRLADLLLELQALDVELLDPRLQDFRGTLRRERKLVVDRIAILRASRPSGGPR